MADNLIEQFFIDIELNTKGVGKQAKEIDKMLDNIGSKAFKREKARSKNLKSTRIREERDFRAKESALASKALKGRLKDHKKQKSSLDSLKKAEISNYSLVEKARQKTEDRRLKREIAIAKARNKLDSSRIKQHVGKLTESNPQVAAMSSFYKQQASLAKSTPTKQAATVHPNKVKNDLIKADKEVRDKQVETSRKALQSRLKEYKQAKEKSLSLKKVEEANTKRIEAAKTKQHVKAMTQKSEELSAMKDYYKQLEVTSARAAKRVARQEAQIARVQGTAYYRGLKQSGMNTSALDSRLAGAVKRGDAAEIANVTSEMKRLNKQMAKHRTTLAGVGMMQKSVGDSTRNMIRSYVSLFALFEGTVAIKRVGQNFQGIEAAMLASSGSIDAAAKDMEFLNRTVDQMGLNLKDTTDAWVKFKFAAQGKISQGEQEDIFTGLSMFGTALKVDDESMKRSQKALIQIDEYCLAA